MDRDRDLLEKLLTAQVLTLAAVNKLLKMQKNPGSIVSDSIGTTVDQIRDERTAIIAELDRISTK